MHKREFNGLCGAPSLLGFGAMRLPCLGKNESSIDMERTGEMIDSAVKGGVSYFDTAYVYHGGNSETALRELLVKRHPRESFLLADKMPVWEVRSKRDFEPIFLRQLERCGVDYFDFYLLHAMDTGKLPAMKKHGGFEYMQKLKKEGRIKNMGFSFHDSPEVLEDVLDAFPGADFVQLQINYLDWTELSSRRMYEIAEERGVPVVVMEPVRGGMLSRLPASLSAPLDRLVPAASQASLALRFCASLPMVATVLSGMSSLFQVEENVAVLGDFTPVTEAERALLFSVAEAISALKPTECTQCAYCMPCPEGVLIPDVFRIFGEWALGGDFWAAKAAYDALSGGRAEDCIGCGVCQERCPQKIRIPAVMEKLAAQGM